MGNTNAAQFQPQQPARQSQQAQFQQPQQRFQPQQQFQQPQQRQPEQFNPSEFSNSIPACAGCQDLNNFINPADPSHAALFQQGQSFRQPAQPAFQPQQQQQQQQFFRQQQQPQQSIQPAF